MAGSRILGSKFNLDNLCTDLFKSEIFTNPFNSENPSSMVVIRDNNQESSVIFPPSEHENLHLKPSISIGEELRNPHCSSCTPSSSSSSSQSNLSSCSSSTDVSDLSTENVGYSSAIIPLSPTGCDDKTVYHPVPASRRKILTTWHGYMNWVYFGLKVSIKKVKGTLVKSPFLTTVLLLGYVYFQRKRLNHQQQRWKALLQENKEKDQRISQLVNQITRMNELMVILQRNSIKK